MTARRSTPRLWVALAVLLGLAACQDAVAPLDQGGIAAPEFSKSESQQHGKKAALLPQVLQQSPKAPKLETYQLSFWVRVNEGGNATINYRPGRGSPAGAPFMLLEIPKNSIRSVDNVRIARTDSVLITATVDTLDFRVKFEPSGLLFFVANPPTLTMWWGNANLDLNGNGVVDGWDWKQLEQLAFWWQTTSTTGVKLRSLNDLSQEYVSASIYHFSQFQLSM